MIYNIWYSMCVFPINPNFRSQAWRRLLGLFHKNSLGIEIVRQTKFCFYSIGTKGKAAEGGGVLGEAFAFGQAAIFPSKSWSCYKSYTSWLKYVDTKFLKEERSSNCLSKSCSSGSSGKAAATSSSTLDSIKSRPAARVEELDLKLLPYSMVHAWAMLETRVEKWYQNVWKFIPGFFRHNSGGFRHNSGFFRYKIFHDGTWTCMFFRLEAWKVPPEQESLMLSRRNRFVPCIFWSVRFSTYCSRIIWSKWNWEAGINSLKASGSWISLLRLK